MWRTDRSVTWQVRDKVIDNFVDMITVLYTDLPSPENKCQHFSLLRKLCFIFVFFLYSVFDHSEEPIECCCIYIAQHTRVTHQKERWDGNVEKGIYPFTFPPTGRWFALKKVSTSHPGLSLSSSVLLCICHASYRGISLQRYYVWFSSGKFEERWFHVVNIWQTSFALTPAVSNTEKSPLLKPIHLQSYPAIDPPGYWLQPSNKIRLRSIPAPIYEHTTSFKVWFHHTCRAKRPDEVV